MEKKEIFTTNPEKAASRVAINGVMLASLFVMLAVIFLEPEKFNFIAIIQMVLSIPLLFVASLVYSKIGYWKETKIWSSFGYITQSFGNFFIINSIGLIASGISKFLAFSYFGLIILLLASYSLINIYHKRKFSSQFFKFLFFLIIISLGGILPLLL